MFKDIFSKSKAVLVPAFLLLAASGSVAVAQSAAADSGDGSQMRHGQKGEFLANLTDEQKAALDEAHKLMQSGDKEGAKAVLDAAGIDRPDFGRGHGMRGPRNEAAEVAIENGDYNAFLAAIADRPEGAPVPSEDTFAKMVKAHQLHEEGDHEAARELMKEVRDEIGVRGQGQ